jgi:hypothetical protein
MGPDPSTFILGAQHRRGRLELRTALFDNIEAHCNWRRLHASLPYKTPTQTARCTSLRTDGSIDRPRVPVNLERVVRRASAVLMVLACSVACGGIVDASAPDTALGNGGELPGGFLACGGDLVGQWLLSSATLVQPPSHWPALCPGSSTTLVPRAHGTATFRADGRFESSATVTNDQGIEVPRACFEGQDCGTIATRLSSATCTPSGLAPCACGIMPADVPIAFVGMYTATGGELTIGAEAAGAPQPRPMPYCVRGRTLSWQLTLDGGEIVQVTADR